MEQQVESTAPARRQMPKRRHRGAADKVYGGSRIGAGKTLLPTANCSSTWARLVKSTIRSLVVHCGGADLISETQKLAARRVSVLEAELVHLEDRFAAAREQGEEPDPLTLDLYGRLADRQRRLADPLGWHRAQRTVSWRDKWLADTSDEEERTGESGTVTVVPSTSEGDGA